MSGQIAGLRAVPCVLTAPRNCRQPARTCFLELETRNGGSDIIDCLRRAHRAALSLVLLLSCSNYPIPRPTQKQVAKVTQKL